MLGLRSIMAAGLGDKVRSLSDEAIADFLLNEMGPERIISIMQIVSKSVHIPSHSALIKELEKTRSLEDVDLAVEWCNRVFHQVIERKGDGPWIVIRTSGEDSFSQIKLHVFALMFMDWIVPKFTDKQNIERIIEHDKEKNLGYSNWLEEKLREGAIG